MASGPKSIARAAFVLFVFALSARASADEVTIRVDARRPGRQLSRYLTGACIEDVNHEIYGGIYSQMIFGESFQEPPRAWPVRNFSAADGEWRVVDGEVRGGGGPGPKLVSVLPPLAEGEVGVEVFLPSAAGGNAGGNPNAVANAGLIVAVNRAGPGADQFDGYEVSLDAGRKRLALGRHRHDYRLLKEVACDASADRWIRLAVRLAGGAIDVSVDGKSILQFEDDHPLKPGTVGLRQWQRPARYRNLWVSAAGKRTDLPFEADPGDPGAVSGMWGPVIRGGALLKAAVEKENPFAGGQSQRITFAGTGKGEASGEVGVENQGLNRWGLAFAAGKPLEGYVWLRAEKPAEVFASLESRDGSRRYARSRVGVAGGEWKRFDFALTPDATDPAGRFALTLAAPGSVVVGHAFLQPGDWGRFKELPLRRDVVEGLIGQGVTVLRYGGSMVNAREYRWKKMVGPRDRRPPYKGTWYPYSSNGWGIGEFLDLCDAAGFLGVPDFNADETPQDLADFVEYANGPAESEWGRLRAAAGHAKPYGLKFMEVGNEEKIDAAYYERFAAIARAVWARDSQMTLVVGDFAYNRPIEDPMNFTGADSKITSLSAHQKILELAKQNGREVWFDVHVWTDEPGASPSLKALPSYIDALEKVAGGAKHQVVVFELNSGNHRQRRALSNAQAIGFAQRDGRVPIVTSANALQCDGQNDNGWDQGLLFLDPTHVWLQPPGYVTQMIARNAQPSVLEAEVTPPVGGLDVTATRGDDGKTVVLQVVNPGGEPAACQVRLDGFAPSQPFAEVETLAGPPDARNTVQEPDAIQPRQAQWRHETKDGAAHYTFPPYSFTVIRFE